MIFHVYQVECFSWRTLLYFMSTKWKRSPGEFYNVSCLRSGKVELEGYTILHAHKVEKFNWRTVRYVMSMKWKSFTGELYYISCPRSAEF